MQEIMRVGDKFVPADDDIKDISHTSTEIMDVARKYKADVLAIVGKGDKHTLVTQHHENETELWQDVIKLIALVQSMADTYDVDAVDIVEIIKFIIEKGVEDDEEK